MLNFINIISTRGERLAIAKGYLIQSHLTRILHYRLTTLHTIYKSILQIFLLFRNHFILNLLLTIVEAALHLALHLVLDDGFGILCKLHGAFTFLKGILKWAQAND